MPGGRVRPVMWPERDVERDTERNAVAHSDRVAMDFGAWIDLGISSEVHGTARHDRVRTELEVTAKQTASLSPSRARRGCRRRRPVRTVSSSATVHAARRHAGPCPWPWSCRTPPSEMAWARPSKQSAVGVGVGVATCSLLTRTGAAGVLLLLWRSAHAADTCRAGSRRAGSTE